MYKLEKLGNFSPKLLLVAVFCAELRTFPISTANLRILDPKFLNFGKKLVSNTAKNVRLLKGLFGSRKTRTRDIAGPFLSGIEHFGAQIAIRLR